jgi:putative lipoprotein
MLGRRGAAFVALAMMMTSGCSSSGAPSRLAESGGRGLAGTSWVAKEIGQSVVLDNVQSTMSIDAAGRVTGRGGCNSYSGMASITGDALRFGPLTSTRMACGPAVDDQERRFFSSLASASRYAFTQEGDLVLYDANGVSVVKLRPSTDRRQA